MLTVIQDSVQQLLPARRRTGQNGWTSFNAACCTHNGETADTRGRGGIKTANGQVSYHCFNCGYTTSYIPGRHLTSKFRKLLSWLGADDATVRSLVIEAVRVKDLVAPEVLDSEPEQEIKFEARPLPAEAVTFHDLNSFYTLNDNQGIPAEAYDAVRYVQDRQIDFDRYSFYWTPETAYNLHRRVIIPFYYQNQIVGYTARATADGVKPKYYSNHPADFVFNLDQQRADSKFVIVCEGPFDAMSVAGVAVSGSEISDQQAELIDRLQREVIVVPDADSAGRKLIDRAIELGWTVSFPIWQETCKDINEAVVRYGRLFVIKSILAARETTRLKIELRRKRMSA
mgnify:CR=1 FL=1